MDKILINVHLMEHFIRFDTVLLRIKLKVNIMDHSNSCPEFNVFRIKLLCKFAHNLGYSLGVLYVESFLVIFHNQFFGLFYSGDITHSITSSFFDNDNTLNQ